MNNLEALDIELYKLFWEWKNSGGEKREPNRDNYFKAKKAYLKEFNKPTDADAKDTD